MTSTVVAGVCGMLVVVVVLAATATVVVLRVRLSRPDRTLRDLRTQRIATVPVPGTTDGAVSERPGGTSLGKPRYASIVRRLAVAPGVDPARARRDAHRLATDDGWVPHPWPGSREPAAYLYDKLDGRTRLSLAISVQTQARTDESGPVGEPVLVLVLTSYAR